MNITTYKNEATRKYELRCEDCGYITTISQRSFFDDRMKNFLCPQCRMIESKKSTKKVVSKKATPIEGVDYVGMWM